MAITRQPKGFMRLKDWIKKKGYSYSETANVLKIHNFNPATNIIRYAKGDRIPHPDFMLKIKNGTNNEVQPNDFYEEYWEKNKKLYIQKSQNILARYCIEPGVDDFK